MVRKLALAVALALGSTSFTVSGLGLGDLKARSHLNQQFDADIELLSVKASDIDGVRVKLASSDAFTRAGVDRSFVLSQLQFTPEVTSAGRTVVRITSDFPIREPFLNFLIEVNWPQGRLLREYTVLLDPPTTTRRSAPRVAAPAVRRSQVHRSPTATTRPASSQTSVSEYGPVRQNETLWGIAKRLRPGGVSMNQMMMSLFEANPQAFRDNNINKLRRGQILRVPTRDEVQKLSRAEANAMFRAQQDSWLAERSTALTEAETAEAAATGAKVESSSETTDQLRIASPQPEVVQEAGAVETEAERQPTVGDLNNQILLAREEAESSRQEAELLRERVEGLRSQLEDMQRLLTLKDDQLAKIQSSVAAAEDTPLEMPEELVEVTGVVEPAVEPTAEPAVEPLILGDTPPLLVEPDVAAVESKEPLVPVDPQTGIIIDDATAEILIEDEVSELLIADTVAADEPATAVPTEPLSEIAETPGPTGVAEPAVPETVVTEEPTVAAEQSAWMAKLEQLIKVKPDLPVLIGLGGGIVLLGGLIGVFAGRRKRKYAADTLVSEPVTAAAASAAPAEAVAAAGEGQAASILSELSPQDPDSPQQEGEGVDPISEADVYIAYGRYQKAEQMLRQAMDKDPKRLALPHKLLEVFYATRNTSAFVTLAGEMMADGRDQADPTAWERAKEMGRELDGNNVMFTAVAGAAPATDTATAVPPDDAPERGNDDSLELDDLELSELARNLEEEAESELANEPEVEPDLSIDLHEAVDQLSTQLEQESVPMEELESLDLDLPTVEAVNPEDVEQEVISLDELALASKLNEELNAGDSQVLDEADLGPDSVLKIDTEMDSTELETEISQLSELSSSLDSIANEVGSSKLDTTLDLDNAFEQAAAEEDELETLDLYDGESSGIVGEDEVETKLDLARAYVEMGDSDGARSILEEVKGEGNDNQKEEAGKLLLQLAS